jgi:peptidoglycan/LPS O-acetylase OafA/YrhL
MLDDAHRIIAGVVLLSVIGIAYGGTFVLKVTRGGVPANDLQRRFYRAGHAHAGVLVILGLLVLVLVQSNEVTRPWSAAPFGILGAAVLMPTGFFLSVTGRDPKAPGRLIALLWAGAVLLTLGLLGAGIGLIAAGLD